MNRIGAGLRAAAVALAAAPLFAACSSMLDNQVAGSRAEPAGSNGTVSFMTFDVIGTSISAGIQSGGINDSTQREGYAYQLALAMGLTPGANWFYPSFRLPGCPAPFTNPLTGARVGGASAAACATRDPLSARANMNNTGIPSLRAAQALDITNLAFPATDTLKLAQFITGSISPVNMVMRQNPTFVIVEIGANDVLGAATRGDPALLTPLAGFTASITAIADSLDSLNPRPSVAMMNIPNITSLPHFTKASALYCLNTGLCPGVPATPPFNSPLFNIGASCAPTGFPGGGPGDTYLLTFPATGAIVSTLAAARAAKIDCTNDSALVAVAGPPAVPTVSAGATINPTEYATISAAVNSFNTAIGTLATARGYALVDANAALAALTTCTPGQTTPCLPFVPSFTTPSTLFGPVFSLDGIHPNKAGHRIIAQIFAAAINAKFGTTLVRALAW